VAEVAQMKAYVAEKDVELKRVKEMGSEER